MRELVTRRFSTAIKRELSANRLHLLSDAKSVLNAFLSHLTVVAQQLLHEIGPEAKREIKQAALDAYDEMDLPYLSGKVEDDLRASFRPIVEQTLDSLLGLESTATVNWAAIVAAVLAVLATIGAALGWRWFQTFAGLAVLIGLTSAAIAGDHAVVFDDAQPGTYLVTVDGAGGVTAVPLKVTRVGKPSPPPPVDPGTNTPFEQAVQQLTQKAIDGGGSKTTGAALAAVYSLVSSSVSDGSLAPDKAFEAVLKASNTVLAVQPDGAKWATFREQLGKALTALADDGSLQTKSQIAGALQSVANGMKRATGFDGNPAQVARLDPAKAGILEGIDLAKLIELIKLVMELIKTFS